MKLKPILLLVPMFAAQLLAVDTTELASVAKRFENPSGDEQYQARMDLNRLVAEATIPGKGDPAAVTKSLVSVLTSPETSAEARKYILRALARVGTADAVEPLTKWLETGEPLLQEEARAALTGIRDPKAIAALERALGKVSGKREKLGLIDALGVQRSSTSVGVLSSCLADPDPDLASAALSAIARIGGVPAVDALRTAIAGGKLAPALKVEAENALLLAAPGDAKIAQGIGQNTASANLKLAAFLASTQASDPSARAALVETALTGREPAIRQAALAEGMVLNLPGLLSSIRAIEKMPAGDRLVVLANLHRLQDRKLAEQLALRCNASADEDGRVGSIAALGKLGTKAAFEAILQALGAREPRINQAAATALAGMAYPEAESALVARLKGTSTPEKILAIKASAFRQVPDGNALLLDIIKGSDVEAAKEAMRTLYASATIDDLKTLCQEAAKTSNAALRPSLVALCERIAGRLKTGEARDLVTRLK